MEPLLVRAARGERTERPPVWLMRQAGRHLPEYRELRREHAFTEAVRDPDIAAEISLQPWERYATDGVVMFSDILVALEPLGLDYRIEDGVGPVIETPIEGPDDVAFDPEPVDAALSYVGDLVARLDDHVGDRAAVIGFAGGPFTLASYAVAGEPAKNHLPVRRFRARYPDAFERLLESLTDVVGAFLSYQTDRGADVVQLFDTYASVLGPADYEAFLRPLHRRILADLDVPSIAFVRNMGGRLGQLAGSGADVISLDWTVDMRAARETLGERPVQGNLDPADLYAEPAVVRERTLDVIDAAGPRGHILNLGHGVHPDTPIEGVTAFVEAAKSIDQ